MDDDVMAQLSAVEAGHEAMADGTWRCPGCSLPYDEIPEGHCWTYAAGGSCSDPAPVSVAEFLTFGQARFNAMMEGGES